MIEPIKEDIGKDVILSFKHNQEGIITSYNKQFVFVKFRNDGQPQAVKRKLLEWTRKRKVINNKSYAMF